MKLLTIIIPSYTEKEEDIFFLLSSIAGQLGVNPSDFEIIIVRDGTDSLDLNEFHFLKLDIRQIMLKTNVGPGLARQAGLDAATGEYIMFCDADDTIHSVGVIGAMLQYIQEQEVDILWTNWLEEYFDPDKKSMIYIEHEFENTWLHGKMFKRDFLKINNIRFHPELRVHEDTYFLNLAASYTDNIASIKIISYVWKWHDNSITRKDNGAYTYDCFIDFMKAWTYSIKIKEIRNPKQMEYSLLQFTIYCYFTLHKTNWLQPQRIKQFKEIEQMFVKYVTPYWRYWQEASPESIAQIYNEERKKRYDNQVEYETLSQWLSRLGLKETID